MYIIDIKIRQYNFKRSVNTNDIYKCVESLPKIIEGIKTDYYIEFDNNEVRIEKIKRYN